MTARLYFLKLSVYAGDRFQKPFFFFWLLWDANTKCITWSWIGTWTRKKIFLCVCLINDVGTMAKLEWVCMLGNSMSALIPWFWSSSYGYKNDFPCFSKIHMKYLEVSGHDVSNLFSHNSRGKVEICTHVYFYVYTYVRYKYIHTQNMIRKQMWLINWGV